LKKQPKKMTLNRETLRELDQTEAMNVAGAAITIRCPYSGQNTCATCVGTCTSNYC
jgi:hypothetical protein